MAVFAALIVMGVLAAVGAVAYVFLFKPLAQNALDVAKRYDQGTDHLREELAQEQSAMQAARAAAEEELRQHLGGDIRPHD